MSFALSLDYGKLEWGGDNLSTLFAQKRNLPAPVLPADAARSPALQQDLPSRSRRGPPRRTLDRRLSQLARLFARLHEQLSGSHGGGDLVNTGQADDGVSGDLFRQLLRKPPADLFRTSDLAHRDRREPELSRQVAGAAGPTASVSMPAWFRSAAAPRVSTSSTPPDGSKAMTGSFSPATPIRHSEFWTGRPRPSSRSCQRHSLPPQPGDPAPR
jgi:hypothetical protein